MNIEKNKREPFFEVRRHLRDAEFWPKHDGEKIPSFFFSWFAILGSFMVLGLLGHMYKSFESNRMSDFINDLFFFLVTILVCSSAWIFHIKGKEAIQLVMEMSQHHKNVYTENAERVINQVERMTKIFYFYSVISNIFFFILTYVFDRECFEMKKVGARHGYICGALFPAWYPLELDYTPWKQMIHLNEFIEIIYLVPKVACACFLFYGCIVLTEERILTLKNFLKNIELTESNVQEVTKKLKEAAKSYSDINKLVKDINSTIGSIFAPSQHILLGLMISLLEFQAVVEKKGTSIPTFFFWFLFESLTCWKGQSLEDASVSLAEQVYEFPWYDLDPSARSIYKIFYGQVRITLQLKCPPMITINLAFFYEVMKGSYSLLMYLQKMYG